MTGSFIEFVLAGGSASGKTSLWEVWSKDGGGKLGIVSWFGRWRCYAFYPRPDTIFERKCLRDIADFCERETTQHRLRAKVRERGIG